VPPRRTRSRSYWNSSSHGRPSALRHDSDNESCSMNTSSTYYSDGGMPVSQHQRLGPLRSHLSANSYKTEGKSPGNGSSGGRGNGNGKNGVGVGRFSPHGIGAERSALKASRRHTSLRVKASPFKVTLRQSLKVTSSSSIPSLPHHSPPQTPQKRISFSFFGASLSSAGDDKSEGSDVSELSIPTVWGGRGVRFPFWFPVMALLAVFGVIVGNHAMEHKSEERIIAEQMKLAKYQLRRQEERNPPKATVAYVLPVFSCFAEDANDPYDDDTFHNAALMLKASIHRQSYKTPLSGSAYDYSMVAIFHPSAVKCGEGGQDRTGILRDLGYIVQIREEPVRLNDIKGDYLRSNAPMDNPDGTKELIRLHAYKLTDYSVVTLVDFTTLVLQPPDDMFNLIVDGGNNAPEYMSNPSIFIQDDSAKPTLPARVDIVYTRDYTTVTPTQFTTGLNLSFLPLRPSEDVFDELVSIYRRGDYSANKGWSNEGYGPFQGSMLTKGLLTYYYNGVHSNSHVELNRCTYANKADAPRLRIDDGSIQCRNKNEEDESCTDCRSVAFDDIVVADLSECNVPWTCQRNTVTLCESFTSVWFELRKEVEEAILSERPNRSLSYCSGEGGDYVPLLIPMQMKS